MPQDEAFALQFLVEFGIAKRDMFGTYTIFDPNDEPGPFGISFNRLKELVECNPKEGWAKWKEDRWSGEYYMTLKARAGDLLPFRACVDNCMIRLSHIIWVFAHEGEWVWPPLQLDHKNGNNRNNSISNLREASNQQNNRNKELRPNNKSGICGVYWYENKQKWIAQIAVNHRQIYLGCFDDFDDACEVRLAAEDKYFGDFSRRVSRFQYTGSQLF